MRYLPQIIASMTLLAAVACTQRENRISDGLAQLARAALELPDDRASYDMIEGKRVCAVTQVNETSWSQYREDKKAQEVLVEAKRGRWRYYVIASSGHIYTKGTDHVNTLTMARYRVAR